VAQEVGDEELLAIPSAIIGRVALLQGHFRDANRLLTQALGPLEKIENWPEWILIKAFNGFALAARGQYVAGLADLHEALDRARAIHYPTGIAASCSVLGFAHIFGGEPHKAVEVARTGADVAQGANEWVYVYSGCGVQAWAYARLGDYAAAEERVARRRETAERLGGRLVLAPVFAAADAELALQTGRVAEAITLAEALAATSRASGESLAVGLAERTWGLALAALEPPDWAGAEAHLATSLATFEADDSRLEMAHTHVAWAEICRAQGDPLAAQHRLDQAAAQFRESGLPWELERIAALRSAAIREPELAL
jgi:tetratricopeptide (TPR) repeat protein